MGGDSTSQFEFPKVSNDAVLRREPPVGQLMRMKISESFYDVRCKQNTELLVKNNVGIAENLIKTPVTAILVHHPNYGGSLKDAPNKWADVLVIEIPTRQIEKDTQISKPN